MENLDKDSWLKTDWGFRDISLALREQKLNEIKKYDVIRNVVIDKEKDEIHNGERVRLYYFFLSGYGICGRVFPLDELVNVNEEIDIIVQNWKLRNGNISLDAQIYHDLYEGEELRVKISRKRPGMDPSFKIFNYIAGFVKDADNGLYERIKEKSRLLVEVFEINSGKKGDLIKVWPLKILENEQVY